MVDKSLKVPLSKKTNGIKPNKCNQCDYAFSRAGNFRSHFKTHTGEKSKKCNQCDYTSSRADSLRAHRGNAKKIIIKDTSWRQTDMVENSKDLMGILWGKNKEKFQMTF